jgi:hypothetical protein
VLALEEWGGDARIAEAETGVGAKWALYARRFFAPLINASETAPSPQCGAKSRFTQNRIILSGACRDLVWVNAAHINPYGGTPLFEITPGSPGFCARLPGKDAEDNPLGVGAGTD